MNFVKGFCFAKQNIFSLDYQQAIVDKKNCSVFLQFLCVFYVKYLLLQLLQELQRLQVLQPVLLLLSVNNRSSRKLVFVLRSTFPALETIDSNRTSKTSCEKSISALLFIKILLYLYLCDIFFKCARLHR